MPNATSKLYDWNVPLVENEVRARSLRGSIANEWTVRHTFAFFVRRAVQRGCALVDKVGDLLNRKAGSEIEVNQ